MSDFEDERPSKRARRDSRSRSPKPRSRRRDHELKEQKVDSRDRDERRSSKHEHEHRRRHRTDEDRKRSISSASDQDRKHRSNRRDRERKEHSKRHRSRSREHERSISPATRQDSHRHKHRHSSRDRQKRSPSPLPYQRSKAPLPSQNDAFTSTDTALAQVPDKQKPNFKPTGKLAALSNTIQTGNATIILKYHEPAESRKPPVSSPWRIYVFKESAILDTIPLHTQSCWLFGRETAVVDYALDHPSCSKQHAVIQFRYIEKRGEFGDKTGKVKPYVLDLESANGTSVNNESVPAAKYVELRDGDVLRFGSSTREYVVQLPPAT